MEKDSAKQKRAPIVVILGHVDHGKTSLLDHIRKTNVAGREAGGITQKIGASVITLSDGKLITFIDTPGHAAFSNMRKSGAKVADIAILVVASNEGIKPQTKEALEYIIEAKIPFIVAATKIDLQGASADMVKDQLSKEGVMFEDFGGDIPMIGISVRTGVGVKELLEMISLVSDLNGIKGSPQNPLLAYVIETSKEKSGLTISVVVKDGNINVGDNIKAENTIGKVRGMFNFRGEQIKSAGPGMPVQILGFEKLPPAGSRIWKETGIQELPQVSEKREIVGLNAIEGKINVIIKANNSGSLEATLANLSKEINVFSAGVGDVTESDVFLAKSCGAYILAFESKVPSQVAKLAETESVKIETFDVIYRLFERVDELSKKDNIDILGEAEITTSFPFEGKKVAGCKVKKGVITVKGSLTLKRGEKVLGEVKVISLKKGKIDITEVEPGEEFGIFFAPQLDFKPGDMLISLRKSQDSR